LTKVGQYGRDIPEPFRVHAGDWRGVPTASPMSQRGGTAINDER
jgi:hypothetical protein